MNYIPNPAPLSDSAFNALYDADPYGLHNASRTHLDEHGPALAPFELWRLGYIDYPRYREMTAR